MGQDTLGAFAGSAYGPVAGAVYALLLLLVCVSDLRTRRIPNRLVSTIGILGLAYSVGVDPWLPGAAHALAGVGVGLSIWLPFYLARTLGAGDVKFFAAAAAWIGAPAALRAALLSALFGGTLALLWLAGVGGRRLIGSRGPELGGRRAAGASRAGAARHVPYGLAMAAGLVVSAWFPSFLQ